MDGTRNLFLCPKGVILVHVVHAACVRGTDAGMAGAPSPGTQPLALLFKPSGQQCRVTLLLKYFASGQGHSL